MQISESRNESGQRLDAADSLQSRLIQVLCLRDRAMEPDNTQAIIDDIKRVAHRLGKETLSRSEYYQKGKFTHYQIYDGGQNWTTLCELAGIKPETKQPVPDEIYFKRLANATEALGRYPRASERKKFGLNMSKRRYPTLTDFINKAIELGYVEDFREDNRHGASASEGKNALPEIVELIKNTLHNRRQEERPVPPIPRNTKRSKWERTGLSGFPYAPQEEQGVLALFTILCSEHILPWQILDLCAGKGIDATCFDETEKREIQVELKYILSKGSWNHPLDDLDYVVCWENRWPDFPKPVIEISKLIRET